MKERHQIIELLGTGGFGSVYKARDTELDRDVAIKRLKAEKFEDNQDLKEQLLAEAKILAGLNHPNIVTIYDVVNSPEGGEIIMEFVSGLTLDKYLEAGPLSLAQFLFVAPQLLSALQTAHENDILHCDIKPTNIMMRKLGDDNFETKLLDFGLSPSRDEPDKKSTKKLLGSIHFMAPETMDSGDFSEQSDLYSLGCIFYYLLTSAFPFQGDSPVQVMAAHIQNQYTPIKELRSDLPESLCQWVQGFMQTKLEDRTMSAKEALNDLLDLPELDILKTISDATERLGKNRTMYYNLSAMKQGLKTEQVRLSDKYKSEFTNKKPKKTSAPQSNVPIAERYQQARPESLWYFSIDNVRKGPVHFTKICELIAQGYVQPDDTIWHPRIGQWTPANQIPEFKDEFTEGEKMPPRPKKKKPVSLRNTAKIKAQQVIQSLNLQQQEFFEEEEYTSPVEIIVVLSASIITVALILWNKDIWQLAILGFATFLLLFAFVFNRIRMKQQDTKWLISGLILPLVSDLIFAIFRPRKGAQCLILMVLAVAFIGYATSHRYTDDSIGKMHLDFLGNWKSWNIAIPNMELPKLELSEIKIPFL
ncbi:protein kinase domain-containing protein [Rubritalea sp.]|uniref:protein kinase domain-containing protein n=1 Tax=Rubritalea sp. TaxID=2109375 RepID=UPI003EF46564